jgi:hypothetical protein
MLTKEGQDAIIIQALSELVAKGEFITLGLNAEGQMVYAKRRPPWGADRC